MSYYYNYYCGYQMPDGKVYPFGPFDHDHNLRPVIEVSASFASDLKDDLYSMPKEWISDELRRAFSYDDNDDDEIYRLLRYMNIEDLPHGSYIKSGYYLLDDVQQYLDNDGDAFDLFYEYLTPTQYAFKLENEMKFGKPEPKVDEEGNEYKQYTCADYQYFAYPDYHSKEYEAHQLRSMFNILDTYYLPKDAKIIVIETEG